MQQGTRQLLPALLTCDGFLLLLCSHVLSLLCCHVCACVLLNCVLLNFPSQATKSLNKGQEESVPLFPWNSSQWEK